MLSGDNWIRQPWTLECSRSSESQKKGWMFYIHWRAEPLMRSATLLNCIIVWNYGGASHDPHLLENPQIFSSAHNDGRCWKNVNSCGSLWIGSTHGMAAELASGCGGLPVVASAVQSCSDTSCKRWLRLRFGGIEPLPKWSLCMCVCVRVCISHLSLQLLEGAISPLPY